MTDFLQSPWVQRITFALGGIVLGYLVERLVVERAHKLAAISRFKWDDLLVESLRGLPTVWLGSGGLYFALNVGPAPPLMVTSVQRILMVVVVGSVALGACASRVARSRCSRPAPRERSAHRRWW